MDLKCPYCNENLFRTEYINFCKSCNFSETYEETEKRIELDIIVEKYYLSSININN